MYWDEEWLKKAAARRKEFKDQLEKSRLHYKKVDVEEILKDEELVPEYVLDHSIEFRIISVYDIEDDL